LTVASNSIYGDLKLGSGSTVSGSGTLVFNKRGTQTITSAGKTLSGFSIQVAGLNGTVQLADALSTSVAFLHTQGTFDAVSYNVTATTITSSGGRVRTLSMGSGTWTATASGTAWNVSGSNLTLNKGTSNILLSNISLNARTFAGAGRTYSKLTIGGATGISTTTITGNNTFDELASTKTVAATLALDSTIQTVAVWSISGTAGNLFSVTGTSATAPAYLISTATPESADYLSISNVRATPLIDTWYAGANSVNGGSLGWIFSVYPNIITANSNFFVFF